MGAPASPFGLAYGIGQGFSGIPTVMNQRANEDLMLQMEKMKLMESQRQMAQRQALDESAQSVKPETTQAASLSPENLGQGLNMSPGGVPGLSQDASSFTMGGMPGQPGQAPGAPLTVQQKGLNLPGADGVPLAPNADQMASLKAPLKTEARAKVYTTPYQQAAYRYNAMADYLDKNGQAEPAMKLRQMGLQAGDMHRQTTISMAARSASLGDYASAMKGLDSLGMGFTAMYKSPDDPSATRIESVQNGKTMYTDLPQNFLGAMIEDPAKATQSNAMFTWRVKSEEGKNARAQASVAERAGYHAAMTKNSMDRNDIMRQNATYKAIAPPATVATVMARKANLLAVAQQNGEDLSPDAAENQAWVESKSSATAKNVPLDVAQKTLLRIEKNHYGQRPEPTDPDYAEWKQAHDKVVAAMDPPSKPITGVRTPKPGPVDKTDREKAAAAIAAAPARAEEIKAKYREITGKDY